MRYDDRLDVADVQIASLQERMARLEAIAVKNDTEHTALWDEVCGIRDRLIPAAIADHERRFMMWGAVVGVVIVAVVVIARGA